MKYIFTLTTVGEYQEHPGFRKPITISRSRCVGWFPTRAKAREAIIENKFDAGEAGYYTYAVIERVRWGVYGSDLNAEWYRIPRKPSFCGRCKRIATPRRWANICWWGLG